MIEGGRARPAIGQKRTVTQKYIWIISARRAIFQSSNSSKPLGLGVWILLTGALLGLLTLVLFGITAFTGNVLFGYTAIAASIYGLPVALILFVVGLAMSIVSPQPDAKNHQTIDVRADADNQKSE